VTSPQDGPTRSFEVTGPVDLRVHLDYGSVRIVARSDTTATVLAAPAIASRQQDVDAAQNVRVSLTGDMLEVRGTASGWRRLVRPGTTEVEIGVPEGSRITVTTAYAEVQLVGAFGDCSVQSTGGDIRVEEVAAGQLQTRYGNVTVDRLADGGRVESTHGTVRVRAAAGTTTLTASSGDVVLDRATGDVTVRNTYGTVEVGAIASGSCIVTTSYGSVGVGIPNGTAAYLDLQSDHGQVRSELDRADEPGAGVERASIRARTSYGAITIRRA
jgi:hypothetical protein